MEDEERKKRHRESQKRWKLKHPEYNKDYSKAWIKRNKKQHSEYGKQYYQAHKAEILKRCRNYHRRTCLSTTNGEKLHNLNKRPYTGYCEICGKEKSRWLHYHHWGEDPNIGLWLCMNCHYMAEGLDKGLDVVYFSVRDSVFVK